VAADDGLKSGRVLLLEGTAFILDLGKNSDAEEELGLAELNAPAGWGFEF